MNARAIAIAAALAALSTTGAQAQVYESVHLGLGHARFSCDGTSSCKLGSLATRLTGGYVVYDRLAVELGFLNFGKASGTLPDAVTGDTEVNYWSSAMTLGVAYQLPITGDWGSSFRLGLASMSSRSTETHQGVTLETSSKTKFKKYWGLGGNYTYSKNVMFELNADFARAPRYQAQKLDVRAISLGSRYTF